MSDSSLPSGNVTFLFTDIEGSTRRWERDPAAMAVALERHHLIVRASITAHGGAPYKTIGDAFQAVFGTAEAAVGAAIAAQRSLAATEWAELGPMLVRMAIHAGAASPVAGDYTAPCLNRLARVLACGFGGQVLLTEIVCRTVAVHLPPGVTLHDLGRHRLRDLLEPEWITNLIIEGLPDHFPPLKSLERHPTNLPVQPGPLIGREDDVAHLQAILARQAVQLVTLTGPGGIGKTRLALHVAAESLGEFEDGAFLVDLAPLSDSTLVLPAIAATLGVRESGGQSLQESLIAYLSDRRFLLVLDNCEHLPGAAPALAGLLASCPRLIVVATSREPLRIRAEQVYPVAPLALPPRGPAPPLDELRQIPAVDLFLQRAQAVDPSFTLSEDNAAAVAAICARLDGLPLAIELAAARIRLLSPTALLARLERRLPMLTGGARDLPHRQQTLRAAIDWSHDLLSADEQLLFRHLAVFAGGFTLPAVEDVGGQTGRRADGQNNTQSSGAPSGHSPQSSLLVFDGLASLVDKSLVRVREDRYSLLETIREYAAERLIDAGEESEFRVAHAAWFLDLAERAEPALKGAAQREWLDRLEIEHDNLRAALAWSIDERDGGRGDRFVLALWRFWELRGHLSEGRAWAERMLAPPDGRDEMTRARLLRAGGSLASSQGDYTLAAARYEESLTIARSVGASAEIAASLNNLANVAQTRGDYARAETLHGEALELRRALGDDWAVASSLQNLGNVARSRGQLAKALALHEESLAIRRRIGDLWGIGYSLNHLGTLARIQGDLDQADRLLTESLAIRREMSDRVGQAATLSNLGNVAGDQGEHDRARVLHTESLTMQRDLGDRWGMAASLHNLGDTSAAAGDHAGALASYGQSLRLFAEVGDRAHVALTLEEIGCVLAEDDRLDLAVRLLATAAALREAIGAPLSPRAQAQLDEVIAGIQNRIEKDAFVARWASGAAAEWTEMVAAVLKLTEQEPSSGG